MKILYNDYVLDWVYNDDYDWVRLTSQYYDCTEHLLRKTNYNGVHPVH